MRNRWIRCSAEKNKAGAVKNYFNSFIRNKPGFTFIITKKFNDLFDVFLTADECSKIKRYLEREHGLTGCLREPTSQQVLSRDCKQKTFRNPNEFREYQQHTLVLLNMPIIQTKHAKSKEHYEKVKSIFTTNQSFRILCFDIEVYEKNRSIMLEIGYVTTSFTPSKEDKPDVSLVTKRHLIIQENLDYKNGDEVPDNRNGFKFGSSETMSTEDAVARLITADTLLL